MSSALALPLLSQGMGRTESIRDLQTLAAMYGKAAAEASLEDWLDELVVYLFECLQASWMCLSLMNEDFGQRETVLWKNGIRCRPSSPHQELCDQVLNTVQQVIAVKDDYVTAPDDDWLQSSRHKGDVQAVAVPLIREGHVYGALGVDRFFAPPTPWSEDLLVLEQVAQCILNCLQLHKRFQALKIRNAQLVQSQNIRTWPSSLLGTSQAIYEVRRQFEQAASVEMPILLQGEPGTYKNVLARILHSWSIRSQGPFVRVNCTLPASVLEVELFGYAHTALPQVNVGRKGAFEAADKGTLYLDQVNSLSSKLQNRILRAVQDMTVERLGGHSSRRVDTRIIASSSCALSHLVDRGLFRSELFHRMNRFPILLPPLRERPEDIETIITNALHAQDSQRGPAIRFTPSALHLLKAHDWPGNIRELEALSVRILMTQKEGRISRGQIRDLLCP